MHSRATDKRADLPAESFSSDARDDLWISRDRLTSLAESLAKDGSLVLSGSLVPLQHIELIGAKQFADHVTYKRITSKAGSRFSRLSIDSQAERGSPDNDLWTTGEILATHLDPIYQQTVAMKGKAEPALSLRLVQINEMRTGDFIAPHEDKEVRFTAVLRLPGEFSGGRFFVENESMRSYPSQESWTLSLFLPRVHGVTKVESGRRQSIVFGCS